MCDKADWGSDRHHGVRKKNIISGRGAQGMNQKAEHLLGHITQGREKKDEEQIG